MEILVAAIAMLASDFLVTLLTQAEARNRPQLAGMLDVVYWVVSILTTTIAVTVLQGHSIWAKVLCVVAISAANYVGTVLGTKVGKRWIAQEEAVTIEQRVARLEAINPHIDTRAK